MNILITGGLGTVGSGLVKELRSRSHRAVSCDLWQDTLNTLCNLPENFRPGQVYNIGRENLHTIEELSDLILKPREVTHAWSGIEEVSA